MKFSHLALALLVMAIWGFNFVVIKLGFAGFPPIFLAFCRFFLLSISAIWFVKRPAVPFKKIVVYGLVFFALQFGCLFLGMYWGVPPGMASLLGQTQVFLLMLFGYLFFHEKVRLWQILGAMIAFSGIVLIGFDIHGEMTWGGFLLVLMAAVAFGLGSTLSKKMGKVNQIALIVWGSLVAWPPLLALSLMVEGPSQILASLTHLHWQAIGSVLYITYLTTLVGFGLWSFLLHHYPLSTVSPFGLLVPVFGMTSSALVVGETFDSWKIIAASLIILGLCINLLARRPVKNKS